MCEVDTCCGFDSLQCILDSLVRLGAVGVAPPVAVGRADVAKANLAGFEEGDQKGLLLLDSAASEQPGQSGGPPKACSGME